MGYSSSHKGYKCLSLFGRIYVSKDVLFNELRFPYFDLFPSSSNSIKSLDSYFSLNPNLSPPFVVCVPQSSQLSPSHSPFAPLAPPIPIHSPTTSLLVSHPSTSSESTSIHPQTSESTTLSAPSFDSVSAPNSILVNTHPMQTRSKSGIHNPRLHPSLFLTHSEPKTVKQALKNAD